MIIKSIDLLSADEYRKYISLIPDIGNYWWLKTPSPGNENCVLVACNHDDVLFSHRFDFVCGVRPFCTFEIENTDNAFWYKPKALIGSHFELQYNQWVILDAYNGEIRALCVLPIVNKRFDAKSREWDTSELKIYLNKMLKDFKKA
jgi:hypothetical protein